MLAYFVVISHSFGLTSAVDNYNRRSALLNELLVKIIRPLQAAMMTTSSARNQQRPWSQLTRSSKDIHRWLGAKFDEAKCQTGSDVEILGVTYDLDNLNVMIRPSAKKRSSVGSTRSSTTTSPTQWRPASSKVSFSSLPRKCGESGPCAPKASVGNAVRQVWDRGSAQRSIGASLIMWRYLGSAGPARKIKEFAADKVDVVILTDEAWQMMDPMNCLGSRQSSSIKPVVNPTRSP